jgi:hypothetical protein
LKNDILLNEPKIKKISFTNCGYMEIYAKFNSKFK